MTLLHPFLESCTFKLNKKANNHTHWKCSFASATSACRAALLLSELEIVDFLCLHHYINGIISIERRCITPCKGYCHYRSKYKGRMHPQAGASYKGDDNLVISITRDAHANGSIGNHELY